MNDAGFGGMMDEAGIEAKRKGAVWIGMRGNGERLGWRTWRGCPKGADDAGLSKAEKRGD